MKNTKFYEQIKKFRHRNLSSNEVFNLGNTPDYLLKLGAKPLPVVMKQKNLKKAIREPDPDSSKTAHGMKRKNIERIPEILQKPVLWVGRDDGKKFALITDIYGEHNEPLLLAMELETQVQNRTVNEITSFYERENCKDYLDRQKNVIIIDEKRAKALSRLLGLQLPTTWKVLDYTETITHAISGVKDEKEKNTLRKGADIAKDIRVSGFNPTNNLITNIRRLDSLTGKANLMKDICDTYKKGCIGTSPEEKEVICNIAAECKQQELLRDVPEGPEP